jgi:gluconate 2-dehydrogenase gamma chain
MNPNDESENNPKETLSRRAFLKGASAVVTIASIGTVAAGCAPSAPATVPAPTPRPEAWGYSEVPMPPDSPPLARILRFFSPHEAQTVEAITARILPGTPDDPGAREAGVVTYIDNMLAFREGFPEATYREPPFVELVEGDLVDDPNIRVSADQIERYGYQSILTPREVYRIGVAAVDTHAQTRLGKRFIDLTEDEQDTIVGDLADDNAKAAFTMFSAEAFFNVLRRHTSEGMFSDPAYGGNRDMVGWKLVGFPGAQRAYTPQEIVTETAPRPPQSLAQLPHFHAGEHAGPHVVLPVSGSRLDPNPKKDPFWPVENK